MARDVDVTIPPPFFYSFRAGYRPPTFGDDALSKGQALIVVPDRVMCFGTGGGAFVEMNLGGGGATAPTLYPIAAAASFTASHGRPYAPEIWVTDPAGEEVETDTYHAAGTVTVVFAQPFTGTLWLR